MKYSECLRFYGITLDAAAAETVNCFFSQACAHHQLKNVSDVGWHVEVHTAKMKAYISMMKDVIREHGAFAGKEDPSWRNLHLPESWIGDHLPDPRMFDSMPWCGYYPGQELPADLIYLPLHLHLFVPSKRNMAS